METDGGMIRWSVDVERNEFHRLETEWTSMQLQNPVEWEKKENWHLMEVKQDVTIMEFDPQHEDRPWEPIPSAAQSGQASSSTAAVARRSNKRKLSTSKTGTTSPVKNRKRKNKKT